MQQGFVVSVYLAKPHLVPELVRVVDKAVSVRGTPIGSTPSSASIVNMCYTCRYEPLVITGSYRSAFKEKEDAVADMVFQALQDSSILRPSAKLNNVTYYTDITHAGSLEAQVQSLTTTVEHLQHENDSLRVQVEHLQHLHHENGQLRAENTSLITRVERLESLVAQLQSENGRLRFENERLRFENGQLRAENASLNTRVERLESLVAQLNSKCESLVAQLSHK